MRALFRHRKPTLPDGSDTVDLTLTGHSAIVVGAARGLGHAIAVAFSNEGAHVAQNIAALPVFLASPNAQNITSQTLNVAGGFVMPP